jgi:hypothetical protein
MDVSDGPGLAVRGKTNNASISPCGTLVVLDELRFAGLANLARIGDLIAFCLMVSIVAADGAVAKRPACCRVIGFSDTMPTFLLRLQIL